MISRSTAGSIAVVICLVAAVIEGICAGRNVRVFFETVRFPRYSAPLWLWSCIGGAYYIVFCFVLFRLLASVPPSRMRTAALVLIGLMLFGNGLSNVAIFRYRHLRLSYAIGNLYAFLDLLLLLLVARLDSVAAWTLGPYLMYRAYALWWGHAVATLNDR